MVFRRMESNRSTANVAQVEEENVGGAIKTPAVLVPIRSGFHPVDISDPLSPGRVVPHFP